MIHIERFLHTHMYKKKERERNKNTSLQVNLSTSAEAFITGFRCWVSFYITHRLIVFQFNNTSLVDDVSLSLFLPPNDYCIPRRTYARHFSDIDLLFRFLRITFFSITPNSDRKSNRY